MSAVFKKVAIFEYTNYREFLRDLYGFLKAEKRHFSFRYFSRAAGFKSPNFLKLVIDGKRNLTAESAERFASALRLNKEETAFFRGLVALNQAATVEERQHHAELLLRFRSFRKARPLQGSIHDYYAHWYFIPVRELIATEGFREDPQWIAKRLTPAITTAEAARALETLLKLGLIRRNERGQLEQTDAVVSTGDDAISAALAKFHQEMIRMGGESIDRIPSEEREISSITMGLSTEGAKRVKEMIRRFRREILEVAREDRGLAEIHELNFQLFPLTRPVRDQEGS